LVSVGVHRWRCGRRRSRLLGSDDGDVDDLRAFVREAYERAEALLRERA